MSKHPHAHVATVVSVAWSAPVEPAESVPTALTRPANVARTVSVAWNARAEHAEFVRTAPTTPANVAKTAAVVPNAHAKPARRNQGSHNWYVFQIFIKKLFFFSMTRDIVSIVLWNMLMLDQIFN